LLYLKNATALSPNISGWIEDREGEWRLHSVWLRTEKP